MYIQYNERHRGNRYIYYSKETIDLIIIKIYSSGY